jgi:adenylosuccinate lyase
MEFCLTSKVTHAFGLRSVVAEAIQTILRREGYENPYEKLKEFTRGKMITEETIKEFISELDVSEDIKSELRNINPQNYIGL